MNMKDIQSLPFLSTTREKLVPNPLAVPSLDYNYTFFGRVQTTELCGTNESLFRHFDKLNFTYYAKLWQPELIYTPAFILRRLKCGTAKFKRNTFICTLPHFLSKICYYFFCEHLLNSGKRVCERKALLMSAHTFFSG